jgi:drug/metabolite transporter (DMT)-like permease
MSKEVIDAGAVLASVGDTKVQPSFVQKAGLWLAAGVGTVIAAVTAGVVYPKQAIEQYKELSAVSIKSALDLFQTVVTQALLPVFTAILGYIFGKGSDSNS